MTEPQPKACYVVGWKRSPLFSGVDKYFVSPGKSTTDINHAWKFDSLSEAEEAAERYAVLSELYERARPLIYRGYHD